MSGAPDPHVEPDPELLARWLAIAALLASARDLQARGGGAWPSLALVAADTANEAVLGTIAVAGGHPPGRDDAFMRVYELALESLRDELRHPMPQSLQERVVRHHRARNGAVHLGVDQPARAVESAIATATELRDLAIAVLPLLEAFRDAGPVAAVARMVSIDPISSSLVAAERLLGEGRLDDAANQLAVALDTTLERVTPPLGSILHVPGIYDNALGSVYRRLNQRASRVEAWILALGLGLRPAGLARLRRVLGQPDYDPQTGKPKFEKRDGSLTRATVEWALRLTTDLVFRLWQGEGLMLGDTWDDD